MQSSRKHLLIVEDEKSLANALCDKCTTEGYQVSVAADGEEGLEIALRTHPAILIIDLIMPKVNGMEFMETVRKDAWGKNVPIVVLTNLSTDSGKLIRGALEAKPILYLVKSDWNISEIVAKIKDIITP